MRLAAALLGLLWACAPPAARPGPPNAAAGGAPSGVAGRVLSASDVAGRADQPLAMQLVLAVPAALAQAALGADTAAPAEQLRFLKAQVPADPAIVVALSAADGGYALALDPGRYLLCLADSELQPPALPATTRGCGPIEVPPGPPLRVDLSSGLGEVLLVGP